MRRDRQIPLSVFPGLTGSSFAYPEGRRSAGTAQVNRGHLCEAPPPGPSAGQERLPGSTAGRFVGVSWTVSPGGNPEVIAPEFRTAFTAVIPSRIILNGRPSLVGRTGQTQDGLPAVELTKGPTAGRPHPLSQQNGSGRRLQ